MCDTDEIPRMFVPCRTASILDLPADMAGATEQRAISIFNHRGNMKIYSKVVDTIRVIFVWVYRARGVKVGKNTLISFGSWIDTQPGTTVIIGNRCIISSGAKILAHDWAKAKMGMTSKIGHYTTTVLEDFVFVGMNSVVLSGIRVGEGAVIGAGSVVTRDVPPYTLVAGNPAKIIRTYDPTLKERINALSC